ncbi:hypothetical protein A2U01_0101872, partial [Trifolium medium]|nr:hypothetical protein [Trifolium medium]
EPGQLNRRGLKGSCKRCGEQGHKKATCKLPPPPPASEPEPSTQHATASQPPPPATQPPPTATANAVTAPPPPAT